MGECIIVDKRCKIYNVNAKDQKEYNIKYPITIEPHRISFLITRKWIPSPNGIYDISHLCGIHECINPNHILFELKCINIKRKKCDVYNKKNILFKKLSDLENDDENKYYIINSNCNCNNGKNKCFRNKKIRYILKEKIFNLGDFVINNYEI